MNHQNSSARRRSILKTQLSACCVAMLGFLAGCSSPRFASQDDLPNEPRKGFVEFYINTTSSDVNHGIIIHKNEGGKLAKIGEIVNQPLKMYAGIERLRVALRPGSHDFALQAVMNKGAQPVKVEVKEGMVTPVRLTLAAQRSTDLGLSARTEFRIIVESEAPVPPAKK